jgi:hypothetical protein
MTVRISCYFYCFLLVQPVNELHFRAHTGGAIEVVAPLSASQRRLIPAGMLTTQQGEAWLRLCLVDGRNNKPGPPMLGNYRRDDAALIFSPRFGLEAGKTYRAYFGRAEDTVINKDYQAAPQNGATPPAVLRILPSSDVLPANVLKFYIYFSGPMRGGQEIFSEFEILDADGNVVSDAWLTDELWDESGQILILYIHPGRIKWGVVLRDVLGPVLLPQRDYTFVVRGTIADADGRKIGVDVRKKFRTTAEDRTRIELKDWRVATPQAGTTEPVTVHFSKAIDHKSLERFLAIQNADGQPVSGKGTIGKDEKSWTWVPRWPWQNVDYRLVVGGRLEDVAGNTPLRPFDMDLQTPPPAAQRLEISFRPKDITK